MTASPSGLPFSGAGEQFATPDTLLPESISLRLPALNKISLSFSTFPDHSSFHFHAILMYFRKSIVLAWQKHVSFLACSHVPSGKEIHYL